MSDNTKNTKNNKQEDKFITIKNKRIPVASIVTLLLGVAAYVFSRIIAYKAQGGITVNASADTVLAFLQFIGIGLVSLAPFAFMLGALVAVANVFIQSKIFKICQGALIVADFILFCAIFLF